MKIARENDEIEEEEEEERKKEKKRDVNFFYKYLRFLKSTTFFNPGIQERDISLPLL